MIKAQVKNGAITLVSTNGKTITYSAGTYVTELAEAKKPPVPYAWFHDADNGFLTFAQQELDHLFYKNETEPARLLAQLDEEKTNKVYTQKDMICSLEIVDGSVVLTMQLSGAYDLFALEMACALERKKPLKKCAHCGAYFFPTGRSDSLYCDRVGKDGFSCKKIGAHRRYRKESAENAVKTLYQNALKRRRYLKTKGTLSQSEFERWRDSAASLYAQFTKGTVTEKTLTDFLKEDKTPKPQSRNSISDYLL